MHEDRTNAFRGSAPAKIDERGRLKIPALFRDFTLSSSDVFVTVYDDLAVRIYPIATYARDVEGNLDTKGGLDRESTRTLRLLNARGHPAQLDSQARVTLSLPIRERTGLVAGTEVIVVGMNTYLEVWTGEALDKYAEEEHGV